MSLPATMLPSWHRDETLYSWAARWHLLAGGGSAKRTGESLFSAPHSCRERDAPASLHELIAQTVGQLGSVRTVLLSRSKLAAYYPFLTSTQRQRFDVLAGAGLPVAWMTRFGMRASALDDSAPRWCPECATADMALLGMTTWRLCHQLPGAWVCVEHGIGLRSLGAGAARAAWHLPPVEARDMLSASQAGAAGINRLQRLATFSVSLIGLDTADLPSLRTQVLAWLTNAGVLTATKPICPERLERWFGKLSLSAAMRASGHAGPLLDGAWIHQLLASRTSAHPLKWLLLVAGIDEEVAGGLPVDFLRTHKLPLACDQDGQHLLWANEDRRIGLQVTQALGAASSLEVAARSLGISTTTLRRNLARAGYGTPQHYVAQQAAERRLVAISAINRLLVENRSASRSDVHRHCKAEVCWLRAHDPQSLQEALAQIHSRTSAQRALF
jgi:hypothetical protein